MADPKNYLVGYELTEQIYAGNRTLVYRGFRTSNGQPVVIKVLRNDFPSFNELVHFRNQYVIAKNLEIPGSVKAYSLETYHNHYALVMEDFGGISLTSYLASLADASNEALEGLPVNEFLPIAIQIASALDGLYHHRVIHKDIKPANILINPTTKQVKLIDFSIASLLPRETQEIQNPNVLEGTLPYISPEQTGRMNRGIDYRTDFYSLGVTFYELLTGKLPFQTDDPMDLVHCHLAKQPIPVDHINNSIPSMLSEIVSKLMAKNAEARYQSALGLKYDLETCLHKWKKTGEIAEFDLATRDLCDRFIIPEKLYGRESEVSSLLATFDRVSAGSTEMMLVAGFSGIGKTAVVNEVHKPIVRQRGYFIKGKFDQFQRNLPFSAFVQAFRDLMGQLLSESDAKVEQWKTQILAALGENAQVVVDVIPELERIIGHQPPAPELSGSAAQNRFNRLFANFISVFTTEEHPLVIFLDDLQWADSASLNLIQLLTSDRERRYLFLIGAYRDNEVNPVHPLMLTLSDIKKNGATVNTITLAPLDLSDLNCLIADTLACSTALAKPLTELVCQKTQGNPFFSTQFLKSLYEDQLIVFDSEARYWQCDITAVRTLALTDDVVEFMALQLRKLPTRTQEVLKFAACIGNQFDLAKLAIVDENSPEETATALWKALQEGLILPVSDVYKFYQEGSNSLSVTSTGEESEQLPVKNDQLAKYKFLHDRVQQAAYSLIPESKKRATHLKIGQLLLSNTKAEEREEKIFDLVNQLNYGVELITQPEERERLARLNLTAGTKAKAATAYQAALEYFIVARKLLATDYWLLQYKLTLALSESVAETAYLNGEFEVMEELIEEVLREARSLLDQINVYEVKIQAYTVQKQFIEALKTAFALLKLLGISFPELPTDADIQRELALTKSHWSARPIHELIDLPEMKEPEKKAALRILNSIVSPAYIALPQFLPLIACEQVKLLIKNGNERNAAFAYGNYAAMLCVVVEDIESGYQFGQLASSLLSKFNAKEITAKVVLCTDGDIKHWKEPARETIKPLLSAYQIGLETGDIMFATYCAFYGFCNSYFAGTNLIELEQEVATYSQAFRELKQETVFSWNELHRQGILNLIQPSTNPGCLEGEAYKETKSLRFHQEINDRLALHIIHSHKLILNYLFEAVEEAVENATIAEKYLDGVMGMFVIPPFYLYDSLARLRWLNNGDTANIETQLAKVTANQKKMQKWASHGPMNHLHKFNLVEAERYRVLEQKLEAIEMYDLAIEGAKKNEYIQEEALANELAAKFYLGWGKEKVAAGYMQEAYYCYAKWGALAKVTDLEQRYPQLLAPILQQNKVLLHQSESVLISTGNSSISSSSQTITGSTTSSWIVDLPTVIKASLALSSEIEVNGLLSTLIQETIKNAGAETGAFILNEEGNWKIVVHCSNTLECSLQSMPIEESQIIPLSVINYVKRTQETLTFDDASAQPRFASDSYMIQHQPHSLLCTPICERGKMRGILYLENNLTTGAFTGERIAILNILCSQAAISLQNARLYQQSQDYAQKLEQFIHELKQMQLQLVQSEKMSALGNLVAGVAHEINNPVGFIAGNLQPAQEYVGDLFKLIDLYQEKFPNPGVEIEAEIEEMDLEYLREDLPKLIGSMNEGVDRIRNISTSLRTFSRADSDRPVAFNIHDGLDSTLLILKHRLKASDFRPAIEVVKEYGNLPLVKCFPGQLNQVFMNVLANAIDALEESNKGRSFREIKALPNQITVQTNLSEDKNLVVIRIKDNGGGMTNEVKENIFNHLFTTKSVGQGTGLGLSISRQIVVEKHGGTLAVNSSLGQGSEFLISIPG